MMYKVPSLICIVAMLSSACFLSCTTSSNAGDKNALVSTQSPTPAISVMEPKKLTQKELAQLAIDSGDKERKGLYSNYEYGYAATIPEGFIGVSSPSPYPQHGFGIPLSNQPEAKVSVDGSFNAAMYASLSEAAENDLEYLRNGNEEVEVLVSKSVKLQNLNAMRVIARYRTKVARTTIIQDLVIAIRRNAEPDEPEVIYTIRLSTTDSSYDVDKDILNKLVSSWTVTPLGK